MLFILFGILGISLGWFIADVIIFILKKTKYKNFLST